MSPTTKTSPAAAATTAIVVSVETGRGVDCVGVAVVDGELGGVGVGEGLGDVEIMGVDVGLGEGVGVGGEVMWFEINACVKVCAASDETGLTSG